MKNIVEIKDLRVSYHTYAGEVQSVRGVSFDIKEGETIAIVGESGCGKSVTAKTIMGLVSTPPGEIKSESKVLVNGKNILEQSEKEWEKYRGAICSMIFQDPYSSLDPRMKVHDIIAEGMRIHKLVHSKEEEIQAVQKLLEQVGLNPEHASRYVHEFSGGQRQRIGIARALAVNPEFLMCDEPISALDVSVQAQVVNLLIKLQKERGLTCMFIAHDLSMVKHISDRVGVMYLGNMVELADSETLYEEPLHPYTKALLSAIPIPDPKVEKQRSQIHLEGEVPSPVNPPEGCHFCNRCKYATEKCSQMAPVMREVKEGHFVACHLYDEK